MKHLLRITLATALAALACTFAAAQTAARADCAPAPKALTTEQAQAGMRNARDHGFLWRISKNGRSSWLFGTLHIAKPEWDFPGPRQREALQQSDTLALELDMLDPAMQQRMLRAFAALPKTALPAPLRERMSARAEAECLPPQVLEPLMPELQIATLESIALRRDGLDAAFGIDNFLAGWGHAAKMDVVSLETPELQLEAIRMHGPAETIEMVSAALDELENGGAVAMLRHLASIWADSRLAELAGYERWCDCLKTAADRAAMTRMVDERNPALADAIAARHAAGQRVFAAVGSLHMIGPKGLPALMAERGYRVERIVPENTTEETSP